MDVQLHPPSLLMGDGLLPGGLVLTVLSAQPGHILKLKAGWTFLLSLQQGTGTARSQLVMMCMLLEGGMIIINLNPLYIFCLKAKCGSRGKIFLLTFLNIPVL